MKALFLRVVGVGVLALGAGGAGPTTAGGAPTTGGPTTMVGVEEVGYDEATRMAMSQMKEGKLGEAYLSASAAIGLDGSRWQAYVAMGMVLHAQGDEAGAKNYLGMAVVRAPDEETGRLMGMARGFSGASGATGATAGAAGGTLEGDVGGDMPGTVGEAVVVASTQVGAGTRPAVLSKEERKEMDVLNLVAEDAGRATVQKDREKYLREFLARSEGFVAARPEEGQVWLMRAVAGVELGEARVGVEAANHLEALGMGDSDDAGVRKVMALLARKGWDSGNTRKLWINGEGMIFVKVEAGEFEMGSAMTSEQITEKYGGKADMTEYKDEVAHDVKISSGFMIGAFDVTRGDFGKFVDETGYKTTAEVKGTGTGHGAEGWGEVPGMDWRNPGFAQTDEEPVVEVSWDDAEAYCAWLSKKEGKKYGLPTEAQWEYACRAGAKTEFFWGDNAEGAENFANVCDQASDRAGGADEPGEAWDDGFGFTSPVGSFGANSWGLYDVSGNVWEWCSDWYGDYGAGGETDPQGPASGTKRAIRGGSWTHLARYCRCAIRDGEDPSSRGSQIGFRVCVEAN